MFTLSGDDSLTEAPSSRLSGISTLAPKLDICRQFRPAATTFVPGQQRTTWRTEAATRCIGGGAFRASVGATVGRGRPGDFDTRHGLKRRNRLDIPRVVPTPSSPDGFTPDVLQESHNTTPSNFSVNHHPCFKRALAIRRWATTHAVISTTLKSNVTDRT